MDQLLAPTIQYATEGFPVTQITADAWQANHSAYQHHAHMLPEFHNFSTTFLPSGRAPKEGEIFKNPDLARTLGVIGKEGRDAFYCGGLCEVMVGYLERVGSYLRKEDFSEFECEWVEPYSTSYRGNYRVFELGPNSQGIAALQILNVLENFEVSKMEHNSADFIHLMVEAKKLAWGDRAQYYADPKFAEIPMEELLSKEYAKERSKLIDMQKATDLVHPGDFSKHGDTVCLSVADKNGMMVTLIQSNYKGTGSGLVPDGLGFCFHDRGQLFSLKEKTANVYAPGKRPFQTIIPAFVTKDEEPFLSFAVMGAGMQPQGHVQILVNLIDFGADVQAAGDAPRWFHYDDNEPTGEVLKGTGSLGLESAFSAQTRAELQRRGHALTNPVGSFGGYQAVLWDSTNKVYKAASDMRKDGNAAAY
eukprot:TRINITY_DN12346_c0_g1_i2.p1 TRINITY_DN12346_c0_g1~~TRINITY_DN12346_c0_g1_i2.p1  ORF type:complete len:419 (+),score=105.65 TRINITY_DN12346_c0_g1_i2:176-1432(+)